MTCYHPLTAFRLISVLTDRGKATIVFDRKELKNHAYTKIELPCGRCVGCRVDHAKSWALRCVHEASMHDENCFITLTFATENLPKDGSLNKSDFQKFMKRLRKKFKGRRIRYYHCGEYGSELRRPHHHACLFGIDFPDKEVWSVRKGVTLYRSDILEKLWPFGFSLIGEVTFESAAYCARYVLKKVLGDRAEDHYRRLDRETGEITDLLPEYTTMSRRPGIGRSWFERYEGDLFPKDFVTLRGVRYKSPRYYDNLYDGIEAVKRRRKERVEVCDYVRLGMKERCMTERMKRKRRVFE